MKKIFSLLILSIATAWVMQAQTINVEPSFWWSGMQETELQLMVSGDRIADFTTSVTSENISIREVVTLENRNYQLIYLDLTGAVPETFNLVFTRGTKKITVPTSLRNGNRQGWRTKASGRPVFLN